MFYDPTAFSFVEVLESHSAAIVDEFNRLGEADFQVWAGVDDWRVLVFRDGLDNQSVRDFDASRELCPKTAEVIDSIPGVTSAAFSRLLPGAVLTPHRDKWCRVRCHMGVSIPDGCGLRVGGVERSWSEGKCMLFNAEYVHEAWNRNTVPRTVLLVDVRAEELSFSPSAHAIPRSWEQWVVGQTQNGRYFGRKALKAAGRVFSFGRDQGAGRYG